MALVSSSEEAARTLQEVRGVGEVYSYVSLSVTLLSLLCALKKNSF
jgi:hypothetical protein